YRLNPRYAIKECLSCGALYTGDFCCSKGSVEDKILIPKLPENRAMCAKCGHPVNGPYCHGCALLREKLEEDLVSYFQNFQNTSESSDDSTNVVNAPREPFVVKQDHGVKSSKNPPPIDECCCECASIGGTTRVGLPPGIYNFSGLGVRRVSCLSKSVRVGRGYINGLAVYNNGLEFGPGKRIKGFGLQ
nr:hypothetical protein [Tanacetum cinerariifolium]